MNKMAMTQKRILAKVVDDTNEKYALRIWLVRLGINGNDFKEDRKILMERLTGFTAFRNEEEKDKWTKRQMAKRKHNTQQTADNQSGQKQTQEQPSPEQQTVQEQSEQTQTQTQETEPQGNIESRGEA